MFIGLGIIAISIMVYLCIPALTTTELQIQRKTIITNARQLVDKAEAENRGLNNEEKLQWDKAIGEALMLQSRIDTITNQENAERTLKESAGRISETRIVDPTTETRTINKKYRGNRELEKRATEAYETAFVSYLSKGEHRISEQDRSILEFRDLQADVNASGGYTVLPLRLVEEIIIAKNNLLWIRQLSTKETLIKAASLGVPTLAHDISDADWTTELLTGNDDTTMDFGRRDLTPHPLAKRIKVSNKLIRVSTLNIEDIVKGRMTYKFAVSEEKAFMTGAGTTLPLGVFTASASGVPTSQDVSSGNTTTAITFDGLINARMFLRAPYRNAKTTRWVFNRTAITKIMLLKDTLNRYIWETSQQVDKPDNLLGTYVAESEYAPNTFTTGLYVGLIGDFSMYQIVDSLDVTIQRLIELYAETNQIGFIARQELDAMPMLGEAFARVTLA